MHANINNALSVLNVHELSKFLQILVNWVEEYDSDIKF